MQSLTNFSSGTHGSTATLLAIRLPMALEGGMRDAAPIGFNSPSISLQSHPFRGQGAAELVLILHARLGKASLPCSPGEPTAQVDALAPANSLKNPEAFFCTVLSTHLLFFRGNRSETSVWKSLRQSVLGRLRSLSIQVSSFCSELVLSRLYSFLPPRTREKAASFQTLFFFQ